jgi:ABC-type polar amino acid transport system ATPase subunit
MGQNIEHNDTIISINNVSKWYGNKIALKDVTCHVDRGQIIIICGPSGCGKSTLLRCINGLEAIQKGDIIVNGMSIRDRSINLPALRSNIGMVFQHFNLYPNKTCLENVTLAPIKVKGIKKAKANRLGMDMLTKVGVDDQAHKYPERLSGGQKQRVGIARALAMTPSIMLIDEPTSALDPEMISEVLNVLTDLARESITMLVATHEMGFAKRVSDETIFMEDGSVIERSDSESFFREPSTARAQDFLSKILA